MNNDIADRLTRLEKEKLTCANQCQAGTTLGLDTNNCTSQPYNPSLTEKYEKQRFNAILESRKASQLEELLYLLNKHPDIARILDLINEVEGRKSW